MTDEPTLVTAPAEGDHGVADHTAHVQEDAAAGNGLAVVSIAKAYDKRAVLSDVSLSVGRGEVRRPARPQRRGQDDLLLFDHGAGEARRGPHPARRRRHHRPADVPPRDPRPRLSAAGNLDLPRPDRRAEHHWRCSKSPSPTRQRAQRRLEQLLDEFGLDAAARRAGDGAVGRRAAPLRDRPRAGRQPVDHAARRAVRRHRPDLDQRHPRPGRAT